MAKTEDQSTRSFAWGFVALVVLGGAGLLWWGGDTTTVEFLPEEARMAQGVSAVFDQPQAEFELPEPVESVPGELAEVPSVPLEEPCLYDEEILEETELSAVADSPFDSTNLNDVIGIGGGAGGKYGGRFGGRRNLRTHGGRQGSVPKEADWSRESYQGTAIGGFQRVIDAPLSTFSIDVDRASYTNVRRMIEAGVLPPPAAVRVEEFINNFDYEPLQPMGEAPLALGVEVASCPWRPEHRLVRIGLASRAPIEHERQPRNLVFLIDVSGSMESENKLPLLRRGLKRLVEDLDEDDSISIVTYASQAKVVLEPTRGHLKETILASLESLSAGGSTHGEGGIRLAYERARKSFLPEGVNRVLLGTDGDFNVGVQSREELVELVQEQAKGGVFLTVLGFGEGNLKDDNLEQIANKGNGHYLYVDSMSEARRVFSEELAANLVTVAKDVKLQVEFNPAEVQSYRLIGYGNRKLADRDFNDDQVDAGEVGEGHGVTAFYEVVPTRKGSVEGVDELRYQEPRLSPTEESASGEILTVKLRYKLPRGLESRRISLAASDDGLRFEEASVDFRFATAVAYFGELLSGSEHVGEGDFGGVLALLEDSLGEDPSGRRTAFFDLVLRAKQLGTQ